MTTAHQAARQLQWPDAYGGVQIPGYQLANFLVCSLIYVGVSYRLFNLTNTLKDSFVPHSNNSALARNAILMAAALAALYVAGLVIRLFVWQRL
jgi:hypothetical protein